MDPDPVSNDETAQVTAPADPPTTTQANTVTEVVEKETNNAANSSMDLGALQASIDSLPDRIVDAIREATAPAKKSTPAPTKTEAPPASAPAAKKSKSFYDVWFGE